MLTPAFRVNRRLFPAASRIRARPFLSIHQRRREAVAVCGAVPVWQAAQLLRYAVMKSARAAASLFQRCLGSACLAELRTLPRLQILEGSTIPQYLSAQLSHPA